MKENFKEKNWFGELTVFLNIGMCRINDTEVNEVTQALGSLGFSNLTLEEDIDHKVFLIA